MKPTRREFLIAAASFAVFSSSTFSQQKKPTRIILLGTKGGPRVAEHRSNAATLILIDDVPYVVDCGYGTSRQLITAGIALNRVRYVFIPSPLRSQPGTRSIDL